MSYSSESSGLIIFFNAFEVERSVTIILLDSHCIILVYF